MLRTMNVESRESEPYSRAIFDADGSLWGGRSKELIQRSAHIIALRGAGSVNGISRKDADQILIDQLIPRLNGMLDDGEVVVMYDGDSDSPEKPDIGYVMGRLRSTFGDACKGRIRFIAVQKRSWYKPEHVQDPLSNAEGEPYETYIFPDNTFANDHSAFTQSTLLANSNKYEQWYIGAAGPIAAEQLKDLNTKVSSGTRNVTLFLAEVNGDLDAQLESDLKKATEAGETKEVEKIKTHIKQRSKRFGSLFNNDKSLALDPKQFQNLNIAVIGR